MGAKEPDVKGSRHARHIIVAGAHPLERLGFRAVLRAAFQCERFDDASHFSELPTLLGRDTHLALLDEKLPGLASLEELRQLRLVHATVKFVFMSTTCTPDEVFTGLLAGANGFISKTLSEAEMIEALRLVSMGHIYVPTCLFNGKALPGDKATAQDWDRIAQLSRRQRQVLQLVCEGGTNRDIARKLEISEATVKVHIGAAFRVIGVTSRIQAAEVFRHHRLALDGEMSSLTSVASQDSVPQN
ncbi:LuxR C-terminal-related transcriptional regulator [Sphingomonas sp. GCM10030256]|uniref:LuxR C-terminal-related transcriptional regulator n=1 Tax=Sphingomonas sp. GCM10030256 TaxID=3273427 RepID=UPI0036158B25